MSRKFSTPSGGTRWISIVLLLATAVIGLTNGITPLTLSFSATADEAISGKSEAAFGPQVPERPLKVCVWTFMASAGTEMEILCNAFGFESTPVVRASRKSLTSQMLPQMKRAVFISQLHCRTYFVPSRFVPWGLLPFFPTTVDMPWRCDHGKAKPSTTV